MTKRDEDTEMRAAAFVVCLPSAGGLVRPDNVFAVCCHCGRSVQHRPYVPRACRKLCLDCGWRQAAKDGDAKVLMTERQWRDVAAELKRGRH